MVLDINELIYKSRKGDGNAFYELINANKEQLYRIAFSYLNNEQDALEAIQETTFRALKNIKKLKQPEYFKTWLIRILLNYCNDELKRNRRMIKLEDSFTKCIHTEERTEKIDILNAVNNLKIIYKEMIVLRYFEDFKIKEICDITQMPEGTIKTRLHRALMELRNELKGGDSLNGY